MAEHILTKTKGLPMCFYVRLKEKEVSFASDDLVMEGDTITAHGLTNGGLQVTGTIKEIIYEEPAKGDWKSIGDGHIPTTYKVKLY